MNEFEELIKIYNIKNKEDYDFLEKVKNIIERKENIIKEVRELANKEDFTMQQKYEMRESILKILDKVGDNNE